MLNDEAQLTPTTAVDHVTQSAAHLSLVEIFIGATVHSLKLPLGGNLLSINQGAFLCRSSRQAPNRLTASRWAYEISGVAAALKSLSPAGQKLGPMLSISMQGLLYALGNLIAGRGLFGQSFGMVLLSLWAFIQPFITIWLSFGSQNLEQLFNFYQNRQAADFTFLGITFWNALIAIVVIKMVICVLVPFILNRYSSAQLDQIENKLINKAKAKFTKNSNLAADLRPQRYLSPVAGALRDMTRPLFLISFILMILFWSVHSPGWSNLIWLSLRPLAVAFIIFYLLRSPRFMHWISRASQKIAPLRPLHLRAVKARDYLANLELD